MPKIPLLVSKCCNIRIWQLTRAFSCGQGCDGSDSHLIWHGTHMHTHCLHMCAMCIWLSPNHNPLPPPSLPPSTDMLIPMGPQIRAIYLTDNRNHDTESMYSSKLKQKIQWPTFISSSVSDPLTVKVLMFSCLGDDILQISPGKIRTLNKWSKNNKGNKHWIMFSPNFSI